MPSRITPAVQQLRLLTRYERGAMFVIVIGGALLLISEVAPLPRVIGFALIAVGITAWFVVRAIRMERLRHAQQVAQIGDVALRRKVFADKPHEFRVITPQSIPGADHYFYDNMQAALEAAGFVLLGDVENVTLTRVAPDLRTFNRALRSADGTVIAEVRHGRRLRADKSPRYDVAFHSEFSDGSVLIVNNTSIAAPISEREPKLIGIFLPASTTWEEILRVHYEVLALKRTLDPAALPTTIRSVDDYIQLEQRLHSVVSERQRRSNFQKESPRRRAARRILEMQKALWATGPHHYRVAAPDEFPNLDHAFYDRFRDEAAALQFRILGDVENMTVNSAIPLRRTFLRVMADPDGTTLAVAYHIRNFNLQIRTIDIETEFSDGTYLSTNNAPIESELIPQLESEKFPPSASFAHLHSRHQERVTQRLKSMPGTTLVSVQTIDDFRAYQARQHAIKARHRQSAGLFNASDMRRLRRRELTPNEVALMAELEQLKREQSIPSPQPS